MPSPDIPTVSRQFTLREVGSYKNLELRAYPIPSLKDGEVLVKIHAVSLNHRDLTIMDDIPHALPVKAELVPLTDMAGEIVALGAGIDAKEWQIGQRVAANCVPDYIDGDMQLKHQMGTWAVMVDGLLMEYKVVLAHCLVVVPDHLSYEEAASLPCAAVSAYNALFGGGHPVNAGDTVLILGTGGVAIFALQFAIAAGINTIITSSSDSKLAIASKLGATHTVNYAKFPEWSKQVLELTAGKGVDHVVETAGPGTVMQSIASTRNGGSISILGDISPDDNVSVTAVFNMLKFKTLTVRGILAGSVVQFKEMLRLMTSHPEITRPVVDKVFPFEQAISAFEYMERQKHVGKVVIKVA